MANIFLNPVGPVPIRDIAMELSRFAAGKMDEGVVHGMRVCRDPNNGSVSIPIPAMLTIMPLEMRTSGIMSQSLRVSLPFMTQEGQQAQQEFPGTIYGSVAPSLIRGHDRVNFWVREDDLGQQPMDTNEGDQYDEGYSEVNYGSETV